MRFPHAPRLWLPLEGGYIALRAFKRPGLLTEIISFRLFPRSPRPAGAITLAGKQGKDFLIHGESADKDKVP